MTTPTKAPREALPDLDPKRMLGYDAIRYVAGYPESYVKEYAASLLESERQAHAAEVERLRGDAERWAPVPGYSDSYMISSLGRVRSLDRIDSDGNKRCGEFMSPYRKTQKGYLAISLHKDGESNEQYVHRLVATAFLSNESGLPQVNHIDGDPAHNSVSNLEWVTNAENQRHARRVLAKGVRAVYGVSVTSGKRVDFPSLEQATEAGFIRANIQKCIAGDRKSHRGHEWFDAAIDQAIARSAHENSAR